MDVPLLREEAQMQLSCEVGWDSGALGTVLCVLSRASTTWCGRPFTHVSFWSGETQLLQCTLWWDKMEKKCCSLQVNVFFLNFYIDEFM